MEAWELGGPGKGRTVDATFPVHARAGTVKAAVVDETLKDLIPEGASVEDEKVSLGRGKFGVGCSSIGDDTSKSLASVWLGNDDADRVRIDSDGAQSGWPGNAGVVCDRIDNGLSGMEHCDGKLFRRSA